MVSITNAINSTLTISQKGKKKKKKSKKQLHRKPKLYNLKMKLWSRAYITINTVTNHATVN